MGGKASGERHDTPFRLARLHIIVCSLRRSLDRGTDKCRLDLELAFSFRGVTRGDIFSLLSFCFVVHDFPRGANALTDPNVRSIVCPGNSGNTRIEQQGEIPNLDGSLGSSAWVLFLVWCSSLPWTEIHLYPVPSKRSMSPAFLTPVRLATQIAIRGYETGVGETALLARNDQRSKRVKACFRQLSVEPT